MTHSYKQRKIISSNKLQVCKKPQTCKGITLLENLVALLILSIGLLGLAGLQAATFKSSKDATLRAIATQQAMDMVNRIRVNTAGVVSGEYDNIPATPPSIGTVTFCDTTICNAAELALFDAWEWNTRNAANLPSGGGTVTRTPMSIINADPLLTPSQYTITIRWDGNRAGSVGIDCDPRNAADLKCVRLEVVAP